MYSGKIFILIMLFAVIGSAGCVQIMQPQRVFVAFYNCENFFDTIHNPGKKDEEFTPAGKNHYTQKIYEQKVHNIATVIQSMEGADGPAIIGLAEVENNTVLNELIKQPEIARTNYQYIWYNGPDERGINVAMLYNPALFKLLQSEALHVDLDSVKLVIDGTKMNTRDVLHVCGILAGDTVHLFINHWPSRSDGDTESRPKRIAAAQVVKKAIDHLESINSKTGIIVMGDFNDNPVDSSIAGVLGASSMVDGTNPAGLHNPFIAIYKGGAGTESYKRSWNLFDQIMVSGALLNNKKGSLLYDSAGVYKPDFLIDHFNGHEGEPYRAWLGSYWLNGYSDHFPVVLYLKKEI